MEKNLTRRKFIGATTGALAGASALSGSAAAHSQWAPGYTTANVNIRDGPGLDHGVLKTAQQNTGIFVVDGPWSSDGYTWWEMQVNACDNGGRVRGYAVSEYTTTAADLCYPSTGTIESGDVYYSWRDSGDHEAIDINAPEGNPIRAAASGTVSYVEWDPNANDCGYYLKIDHGNGVHTLYCHCSAIHVNAGDWVDQQQHIADIGTSGNAYASDPHVHFQVQSPEYSAVYIPAEVGHHVYSRSGIPRNYW